MNKQGIGFDLVEIERIEELITKYGQKFLSKIYTKNEIRLCKRKSKQAEFFAGRFAAKEAVVKLLGTGFRNIYHSDIEVLSDKIGKPVCVTFPSIDISITHTKNIAGAIAVYK